MALPTLIAYEPPLTDLPASRATWPLERDRAAVLVHDLQRYFLRPYAPGCAALETALASTARVLRAARAAGVPVFYTAQTGDQDPVARGLQGDLWGAGMSAVPDHTDIVPEVAPEPGDTVLVKHRYSAFARTDLAERLAARGRDQLVLTGVYAHIGVTATAFEAFQTEVHPFVVADGVADFGPEQHRRALEQVAGCCGVVTTADAVVEALADEAAASDGSPFERTLREALSRELGADVAAAAFADPGADLFELGLNSLQAFEVLDELADLGVDVEFGEFTRTATVAFLREQGGVPAGGR